MMQLQIRHTGTSSDNKPLFVVIYNGKQSQPVTLTAPREIFVGTHNTNLQQDLHWYLEKYIELPIEPDCTHAKAVEDALSKWGQDCFDILFTDRQAQTWYNDARQNGLTKLHLEIISDDPAVLAWPWEALKSQHDGLLAQQCCISRRIDNIGDIIPPSVALPKDQLNILYIISRPYGNNDVAFQTLARPLIDHIKDKGWPV